MKKFLFFGAPLGENGREWILLLLRLFIGFMMLRHGLSKLESFSALSTTFPDPLGVTPLISLLLSISAEVGCSLLLILGIFTRLITLPLIFNMCVAIWVIHGNDPFQAKELAVMYLMVYVLFFFVGGERFSLDYWIFGRKQK